MNRISKSGTDEERCETLRTREDREARQSTSTYATSTHEWKKQKWKDQNNKIQWIFVKDYEHLDNLALTYEHQDNFTLNYEH